MGVCKKDFLFIIFIFLIKIYQIAGIQCFRRSNVSTLTKNSVCDIEYFKTVDYFLARMAVVADYDKICGTAGLLRRLLRKITDTRWTKYTEFSVKKPSCTTYLPTIDGMKRYYESLDSVTIYHSKNANDPVFTAGILEVDEKTRIPLFISARIYPRHIKLNEKDPIPYNDIHTLDQLDDYEEDYLLSPSLGGSSKCYNKILMARQLREQFAFIPDSNKDYRGCIVERGKSYWKENEQWVHNFLGQNPKGRVFWRVVLRYGTNITGLTKMAKPKPVALVLQYDAYTDDNDNTTFVFSSSEMIFFNDNEHGCNYIEQIYNNKEFDKRKCSPRGLTSLMGPLVHKGERDQLHEKCFYFPIFEYNYNYLFCQSQENWYIHSIQTNAKVGYEWSNGSLPKGHSFMFLFSIKYEAFLYYSYGKNSTEWSIKKLFSNNLKMGETVHHGKRDIPYEICIYVRISKKHYYYCQSEVTYVWFIQELLPHGKVGNVTDRGNWTQEYSIAFTYNMNGQTFFFLSSSRTHNYSIYELLPCGTIGQLISQSSWEYQVENCFSYTDCSIVSIYCVVKGEKNMWFIARPFLNGTVVIYDKNFDKIKYPIVFSFLINDRAMIYKGSSSSKDYSVFELTYSGAVISEHKSGQWSTAYDACFAFVHDESNNYLYCHSLTDNFHWFIKEIDCDGDIKGVIDQGHWNDSFTVALVFEINNEKYFYRSGKSKPHWFIHKLLPSGKMGEQTSTGSHKVEYEHCVTYQVNGELYLYCRSLLLEGRHWIICQLLADGKLGSTTDEGDLYHKYTALVPYEYEQKTFIFMDGNDHPDYWFINELLPGGKMGPITSQQNWTHPKIGRIDKCFPFTDGLLQYAYCQTKSEHFKSAVVLTFLAGGLMASEPVWDSFVPEIYTVLVPYKINNRQFFYTSLKQFWHVQEVQV